MQIEIEASDALYALSAVRKAGTEAHRIRRFLYETRAPKVECEIAETAAAAYDRLELVIAIALYPEPVPETTPMFDQAWP